MSDGQLPEVKSKEDTSQFSAEFTNLPIVSPSSYNRPYAEEISFPVGMKRKNDDQGFSYGPYARELENEESGPAHLESDSDENSYVSASVSEYSDDGMMEDQSFNHRGSIVISISYRFSIVLDICLFQTITTIVHQ